MLLGMLRRIRIRHVALRCHTISVSDCRWPAEGTRSLVCSVWSERTLLDLMVDRTDLHEHVVFPSVCRWRDSLLFCHHRPHGPWLNRRGSTFEARHCWHQSTALNAATSAHGISTMPANRLSESVGVRSVPPCIRGRLMTTMSAAVNQSVFNVCGALATSDDQTHHAAPAAWFVGSQWCVLTTILPDLHVASHHIQRARCSDCRVCSRVPLPDVRNRRPEGLQISFLSCSGRSHPRFGLGLVREAAGL